MDADLVSLMPMIPERQPNPIPESNIYEMAWGAEEMAFLTFVILKQLLHI